MFWAEELELKPRGGTKAWKGWSLEPGGAGSGAGDGRGMGKGWMLAREGWSTGWCEAPKSREGET